MRCCSKAKNAGKKSNLSAAWAVRFTLHPGSRQAAVPGGDATWVAGSQLWLQPRAWPGRGAARGGPVGPTSGGPVGQLARGAQAHASHALAQLLREVRGGLSLAAARWSQLRLQPQRAAASPCAPARRAPWGRRASRTCCAPARRTGTTRRPARAGGRAGGRRGPGQLQRGRVAGGVVTRNRAQLAAPTHLALAALDGLDQHVPARQAAGHGAGGVAAAQHVRQQLLEAGGVGAVVAGHRALEEAAMGRGGAVQRRWRQLGADTGAVAC
jgi:hypothetical protein